LGRLPVHAQVSVADDVVDCDILAIVARPHAEVAALLETPRGWCEFLLLHPNVKACAAEPAADGRRIVLHFGSKHFQPVELSRPLGVGARLLAAGYFATLGRDKIGFSTMGTDAQGRPMFVGGLAGAIERNVVRHFLAIETVLAAQAAE
jgi:hypothetical protein